MHSSGNNSHGSSNNSSNPNGSNNHGYSRRPSANGRNDFAQQQAVNYMLQQQQQFGYMNGGYYPGAAAPGAPMFPYPAYNGAYPQDFQGYQGLPFNTGRQQNMYGGGHPNGSAGRSQNRNIKNHGGSASSSPVAHKNSLNTYNSSHHHHSNSHHHPHPNSSAAASPVPIVPGLASPALPLASVPVPHASGSYRPNSSVSGTPKTPYQGSPAISSPSKITIKNPKGEDVNLSALASKSQSSSAVTTPKLNNNVKLAPGKEAAIAPAAPAAASPAKSQNDAVSEFKARIKAAAEAKARKQKEEEEKKQKEEEEKKQKEADEKKKKEEEEKKQKEEKEEEEKKQKEEKEEEEKKQKEAEKLKKKQEQEEQEAKKAQAENEAALAAKQQEAEAAAKAAAETVESVAEQPAEEEAAEEKETAAAVPTSETSIKEESREGSEPTSLPKKPLEEEAEKEEEGLNLTQLTQVLEAAKPIENPFEFKYPEGFQGPDAKLKPAFEQSKKLKYDPVFLLQFQAPLKLVVDKEWREKHSHLINVAEQNGRSGGSMRNSSNFRNTPGGFGTGSNIGGARGGSPMTGSMRSQSNLRKGFGGETKSGSRQSSRRRGGGGGGSGSRRPDGRSDSKRANSKKVPKDVDRVIASIESQINQNAAEKENAEPVKPLEKSATRWVPRSLRNKSAEVVVEKNPDGSEKYNEEEIKRRTQSLLNKLTLEMFEPITNDIIKLAEQSKWEEDGKSLKTVLELTFAKACDEPHWSSMYAQFCAKMVKNFSPDVKDQTIINKASGLPESGGKLVRKCLLTRCQMEFEKGWSDDIPTNSDGTPIEAEMMSDEYYKAAAAKRRGLGLVRFIGELYALNLVSEQVVSYCLYSQSQNTVDPREDTLESLTQFVRTVGPIIDYSDKASAQVKATLNKVFEHIKHVATLKIPSRIRFKLMDLIDLRNSKWNDETTKGPKTIAEIHADAKRAEDEKKRADLKKNKRSFFGGGGGSGGGSRQNSNSNWDHSQTVSKTDMQNFGKVRNSSEKSLGPTNNFNKRASRQSSNNLVANAARQNSRRSPSNPVGPASTGSGNAQPEDKSSSKINMFSVLGHHEQGEADESESESEESEAEHEHGAAAAAAPTAKQSSDEAAAPTPAAKPAAAPAAAESAPASKEEEVREAEEKPKGPEQEPTA